MPEFSIQTIAERVGGELIGAPDLVIRRLEELREAKEGELSFIGSANHLPGWDQSQASAALITRTLLSRDQALARTGPTRALVLVDSADLAMARILEDFAPPEPRPEPGIHPTAVIDPTAELGEGVAVGAGCVIGARVRIGAGTALLPRVTVLDDAEIGRDCVLWPGAVVRDRCRLGDRCILHPNAVIGADGFGYRPQKTDQGVRIVKVPQIGTVWIGDDVEIGACATIDRGKFSATTIGDQCKLDNHVQIGHNCRVGAMTLISGCTGVAGSVQIGEGVIMGGMVAVRDHVSIGAGSKVAGGAQIASNLPPGGEYAHIPARPLRDAAKEMMALTRLPELLKRVKKLEAMLKA